MISASIVIASAAPELTLSIRTSGTAATVAELVAEDLELVVGQASRRYELLAAVQETVAAGE